MPVRSDERAASLVIYEPGPGGSDDPARITPWTEVVPAEDGTFRVKLLSGRRYRA